MTAAAAQEVTRLTEELQGLLSMRVAQEEGASIRPGTLRGRRQGVGAPLVELGTLVGVGPRRLVKVGVVGRGGGRVMLVNICALVTQPLVALSTQALSESGLGALGAALLHVAALRSRMFERSSQQETVRSQCVVPEAGSSARRVLAPEESLT